MKKAMVKNGMLVLSRAGGPRAWYSRHLGNAGWEKASRGFPAVVVASGNLRERWDSECGETLVEENEHAPYRVHIKMLPITVGMHSMSWVPEGTHEDVQALDSKKLHELDPEVVAKLCAEHGQDVLVTTQGLHEWGFAVHLETENLNAIKLEEARRDRVEAITKEVCEFVLKNTKAIMPPPYMKLNFANTRVTLTSSVTMDVDDLKATMTPQRAKHLQTLLDEITKLESC